MDVNGNAKDPTEKILIDSLIASGASVEYAQSQARMLFDPDTYMSRFVFTNKVIPPHQRSKLLISGCAVGGEVLAALRCGYKEVVGTEIWSVYSHICRERFAQNDRVTVVHYDGGRAPFEGETFDVVMTCHIIEHTGDPRFYFIDHTKLVRPGGYLFIEFPTRFHWMELHTGVFSLEWLPLWLRSSLISVLASKFSPLSPKNKIHYATIKNTLRPVSLWQMRRWIRIEGLGLSLVSTENPAPGVVRALFRKC